MKLLRTLCLVAALGLAGTEAASAGPMSVAPAASLTAAAPAANLEKVVLVCGPFRCVRRWGWRYGWRRPWGWRYGWRGYGWRRWRRW